MWTIATKAVFAIATLLIAAALAEAAPPDKSGVKPSVISLPSGAGSIEGLGESFEPQLNTGSSSYGIGIIIPPGRAGLQPRLRLAYNSSLGNSFVGLGWSLDLPAIKRQTDKGFPNYNNQDVFVFGGEELIPLSDGTWRCENESAFQRFRPLDADGDGEVDSWEVTERSGVRQFYGRHRGLGSRWSTIAHPRPPTVDLRAFDRTYCWALDQTLDLHGNRVDYEYILGSGVLYPSRITWSHLATGGRTNYHEALFRYEDRPDVFDDYRPTFSARIDKRLQGIEVRSFYDGQSHLVRAYQLDYSRPADEPGIDSGISLLRQFTQFDRTGGTNNYLPPLRFDYSPFGLSLRQVARVSPLPGLDLLDGESVQIADMNGDGLPDLVASGGGIANPQRVAWNLGADPASGLIRFDSPTNVVNSSSIKLTNAESTLADMDGDGLVDYAQLVTDGLTGKRLLIHRNRQRLDRPGPRLAGFFDAPLPAFGGGPREISFDDVNVRQMDVNFDKTTDFVRTSTGFPNHRFSYYWADLNGKWHSTNGVPFRTDMGNFDLRFSDASGTSNDRVKLADMNGDRLPDLVYLEITGSIVRKLRVHYWPYSGLGQWAEHRVMTSDIGEIFEIGSAQPRDMLVQDFTGDGLADLVLIQAGNPSTLEVRVNLAGQKWAPMMREGGFPRYVPEDTVLRQADFNGNGSTDLVFRNRFLGGDRLEFVDLLPAGKPNLLTTIDNGLGKITEITYGSSTEDLIRAREAGAPWQTHCPFPVQVVRRIRTTCGLDLDGLDDTGRQDANGRTFTTDQYVSEFRYRDAYYDGFEREFRGFAFAERVDYGDDFLIDTNLAVMLPSTGWDRAKTPTGQVSGPTLVTRFRFLTGAADDKDNDEYPPGWTGAVLRDELTPAGGREEKVLKGVQVWEEKVDPWVLHDPLMTGDFDRGCFLAVTSTNASDHVRMTPDDFVYRRSRQEWTVRRLYRPREAITNQVPDTEGVFRPLLVNTPSPPGRFDSESRKVFVIGGEGGSGRSVSYAFVSAVTNEIIEANGVLSTALGHPIRPPIMTRSLTDQDDYGNAIRKEDWGVINRPGYDDERFTIIDYAQSGETLSRWILDRPVRIRVTDEQGVFVGETRNYYDGDPFSGRPLGEVGPRGLPTRVEKLINGAVLPPKLSEISSTIGDPQKAPGAGIQLERRRYDPYGNIVETRDPLYSQPSGGHARELGYDELFRTYVVSESIHVGNGKAPLRAGAAYDVGGGVITASTNFNDNVTTYAYDSFYRLVAIVKPGDTSDFPTEQFEYRPADPLRRIEYVYSSAGRLTLVPARDATVVSRVTTRSREKPGEAGTFEVSALTDGLGHKLGIIQEGETAQIRIYKDLKGYSRRNLERVSYLPFTLPTASYVNSPAGTSFLNLYHDPLGRVIRSVNPPETSGPTARRTETRTHLLPLETVLYDEEDIEATSQHFGTPHVQYKDGLDRLIGVDEVVKLNDDGTPGSPTVAWPTRYGYDLNDKLTHITDSQGNQKWFRYDGLGRKLFMNDPDRGTMTYTYDDASNLRETGDAKSQVIRYTYDGVNRLLTEDYRDGGVAADVRRLTPKPVISNQKSVISQSLLTSAATEDGVDVTYYYDAPLLNLDIGNGTTATAQNTKGFLAYVRDLTGEEHTSYDARGRVTYTVKRIKDPLHGSLVNFRTGFAYDSLDRVTRLTYPDDDFVFHQYNARNLLERIHGGQIVGALGTSNIISGIDYLPSDQLAQIDYGNNTRTAYSYDPRLRLNSLITHHASRITEPLINFTYDFDGVSNIKSIADNRPASSVPAGDPRRNTQIFQYDDLYRITRAKYVFAVPPSPLPTGWGEGQGEGNSIHYRYDRIGNMLEQNSDIVHDEKGLSVTDLGVMSYGGAAGGTNRIGRTSVDPGPHALSSILHSPSSPRLYPYDANGNMLITDGLTNTWDFKDRLIRVESTNMAADYAYDYTDRRITKRVIPRSYPLPSDGRGAGGEGVTLYIDRFAEVRPGEVATKYIWNGETRVTRFTAQLSPGPRVQRLRYARGWNLLASAVGGARLPSSPDLLFAARWNSANSDWQSLSASDTLAVQTVLWLRSGGDGTLTLSGTPVFTSSRLVNGPVFLSGWDFEAMPLTTNLPAGMDAWIWDATMQNWLTRLSGPLAISNLPSTLDSGCVLFARSSSTVMLPNPDAALTIRFYHQDHLGSSSVLTDAAGNLVEETANYAFGHPRNQHQPRLLAEPYAFTQKERDGESRLSYFEARYLHGRLGRFVTADPLTDNPPATALTHPQMVHSYAYAGNNPVVQTDPDGEFAAGVYLAAGLLVRGVVVAVQWVARAEMATLAYDYVVPPANAPKPGEQTQKPITEVDLAKEAAKRVVLDKAGKVIAGTKTIQKAINKTTNAGHKTARAELRSSAKPEVTRSGTPASKAELRNIKQSVTETREGLRKDATELLAEGVSQVSESPFNKQENTKSNTRIENVGNSSSTQQQLEPEK